MTKVRGVEPADVAVAADILRSGGLVAFPTETVYGLGAAITEAEAVRRVFEAKGRPATDPLIVHVGDVSAAMALADRWRIEAVALAQRFWPGPLTLVVPRAAHVPSEVCAGGANVGLRVPAHPVALSLLNQAGVPVAAPSANRFGRISPTEAAHVVEELDGRIDLILDGGPTPLGVESTVVDLSGAVPRLLRPGGITVEDLRTVLDQLDVPDRLVVSEAVVASGPGQLLVHYAPSTPLVLVEGPETVVAGLIAELGASGVSASEVVLAPEHDDAASELYRALRSADDTGADLLVVRARSGDGLGRAINDRLFRSARGVVVVDTAPGSIRRVLAAVRGPAEDDR